MARLMPSNDGHHDTEFLLTPNFGKAAEHRVAAVLSQQGGIVTGPFGYDYPGVDLIVTRGPNSDPHQIEVKTTGGSVATVSPLYPGDKGFIVIEKRTKNTFRYYVLRPQQLRPLMEDNIGIHGKPGVRIKNLRKYRDDDIITILSEPKEKTPYQKKYSKFFKKLDSEARKKDGYYRYGWDWGKVSKEAHKLTRKELKASNS
tara:strand:- start:86 stop:688 length:603 start_codon:yes stop_codon:yes gene_type:complete